jgi:hypothetical protein
MPVQNLEFLVIVEDLIKDVRGEGLIGFLRASLELDLIHQHQMLPLDFMAHLVEKSEVRECRGCRRQLLSLLIESLVENIALFQIVWLGVGLHGVRPPSNDNFFLVRNLHLPIYVSINCTILGYFLS